MSPRPPFNISIDHQMSLLHHFWPSFHKRKKLLLHKHHVVLHWEKNQHSPIQSDSKNLLWFYFPVLSQSGGQLNTWTLLIFPLLWVLADFQREDVSTLNIVMQKGRDWMQSGHEREVEKEKTSQIERGEKKRKSNRAGKRRTDCKRMSRRAKKGCLHLLIHAERTCLFPSPRWCTQGRNDKCAFSE